VKRCGNWRHAWAAGHKISPGGQGYLAGVLTFNAADHGGFAGEIFWEKPAGLGGKDGKTFPDGFTMKNTKLF
jgi:hypothetical protein